MSRELPDEGLRRGSLDAVKPRKGRRAEGRKGEARKGSEQKAKY